MNKLLQPTLTRRVMLAVVFAIVLIWLFLMAFEYSLARWQESHENPALTDFNQQIIDALDKATDDQSAATIASGVDHMIETSRQRAGVSGSFIFKVMNARHHTVYLSSEQASQLTEHAGNQSRQQVHDTWYQVATLITPTWTVVTGQSRLGSLFLLKMISGEITLDVFLSLPIALLPVWLAVSTGLRPLRKMSERIAARSVNDLSPIGVHSQYTEIKPLITALDDLLAKLKATIHRERAFVHDAAHELRTPMAVISVQAHALSKASNDADKHESAAALHASLQRASHLVHQLLMLARLDAQVVTETSEVDLAQLLRQMLADFAPAASARGIELVLEAPDQLRLNVSVPAFQSVINNLIDNAIRYGREGGRITVDLQQDNAGLALSVTDDGPGIAIENRQKVFERFFRGSGHDSSGTGLGLAIVTQAAHLLGGTVELTEGPNRCGCCFTLRISSTNSAEHVAMARS
ncbi:MAG TPA: ATP-binding protein [Steroidobacteraceae bacterium]|nr:ATP-binding protein [Steroidobacteraceae bacterium]